MATFVKGRISNRCLIYSFIFLQFLFACLKYDSHRKERTQSSLLAFKKQPLATLDGDVFDFILDPRLSRRNNFGFLFERALKRAGKTHGNFLEIGGGSGKFFDHNMNSFGHLIANYVIIEPYAHLSKDGKPLQELMENVNKWVFEHECGTSYSNVTVIHDFSTKTEVIQAFPDSYFDFVYIDGDHSYIGAKSDLINYYAKVRHGGVIAGHDYCCSIEEYKKVLHAPWCGKYIYPHSTSNKLKDGKNKASWCDIYKGAEEFAKEHNFYWFYTLEGRYGEDAAGTDNPSYFTFKQR